MVKVYCTSMLMMHELIGHALIIRGLPVIFVVRLGAPNKLSVKDSPASALHAQSNVACFATGIWSREVSSSAHVSFLTFLPIFTLHRSLRHTPSVQKYKAIRAKISENIEIRKNNIISSSTQPKEEFPCALCWDSLKLRGSRIFT